MVNNIILVILEEIEMKSYKNILQYIVLSLILFGCSNGGSSASGGTAAPDLSSLSIVAPSELPSTSQRAYVYLKNNGTSSLTGLSYSIQNNTTGANISIPGNQCANIGSQSSCTLSIPLPDQSQNEGAFTVIANGGSGSNPLSATIGLVNMPANAAVGAAGITLYAPRTVVANSNGPTQVMVTAVVSSPNAGSFQQINLASSASGNTLLNTLVVSNNNTGTMLAYGTVVEFVLTLPSSLSDNGSLPIYTQIVANGVASTGTNASDSVMLKSSGGILNILPSAVSLSGNKESQIITLYNSGNSSIEPGSAAFSPLVNGLSINTSVPLSCGANLAPGATCNYLVSFNANAETKNNPSGVSNLSFSNENNVSSLIEYQYNTTAGLSVKANGSSIISFETKLPQQQSESLQISIKNTGTAYESGFSVSFSGGTSGVLSLVSGLGDSCSVTNNGGNYIISNRLAAKAFCTATLVYASNTEINPAQSSIMNISYFASGLSQQQTYTIPISYQTELGNPLLQITPSTYSFGSIVADGTSSKSTVFTISNIGYGPIDITPSIYNKNGNWFTQESTTCGQKLDADSSCTVTVQAGPLSSEISKIGSGRLNVTYNNLTESAALLANFSAYNPGQPNIIIASITADNSRGGNGTSGFPFGYFTESAGAVVTITYKNSESAAEARDFNVSIPETALNNFSVRSNGCNVDLKPGTECFVTLRPNTGIVAQDTIDLTGFSYTVSGSNYEPKPEWSNGNTVYANVSSNGNLFLSPFGEAAISKGATMNAYLTLVDSINVAAPVNVIITSSSPSALAVSPSGCALTESVQCLITVTGESVGMASITVSASGYTSRTTSSLSVIPGWVFISGSDTYDGGITSLNLDKWGSVYAGSFRGNLYEYDIVGKPLPTDNIDNFMLLTNDTQVGWVRDISIDPITQLVYFSLAGYVYGVESGVTNQSTYIISSSSFGDVAAGSYSSALAAFNGNVYYSFQSLLETDNFYNGSTVVQTGVFSAPGGETSIILDSQKNMWISNQAGGSVSADFQLGICGQNYSNCIVMDSGGGLIASIAPFNNSESSIVAIMYNGYFAIYNYNERITLNPLPLGSGPVAWNPNDGNLYVWTPGGTQNGVTIPPGVSAFSSSNGSYLYTIGGDELSNVRRMYIDVNRNIIYVVDYDADQRIPYGIYFYSF